MAACIYNVSHEEDDVATETTLHTNLLIVPHILVCTGTYFALTTRNDASYQGCGGCCLHTFLFPT